ncbi:hypothetical protein [Janthinobacterium lividum]|uniref:hypothetical protein n=1 Tax=Janthinobacterium lividum TaxID=29581 RepID=UPI0020928C34|nr:hypothetical protein [Janthinobacterium lividum]
MFRPRHAGLQGDAVGFLQKIIVAQRMHDDAVGIRQDHHIVGVDDLLVQGFHGGQRVRVQQAVLLDQQGQVGFAGRRKVGRGRGRQAKGD